MSFETKMAVLIAQFSAGAIKEAAFKEEMKKLVAASTPAPSGLSIKSGEKGTLVVRGEGFIVGQLYASQWESLLTDDNVKQVRDFIEANRATLAARPPKKDKKAGAAPTVAPVAAPASPTVTLPPGTDVAALLAMLNKAKT